MKKIPPRELHGATVLQFMIFDENVRSTGRTKHSIAGVIMDMPSGLVIAQDPNTEGAFYLLYCDENWQVLTDTWHESMSKAKGQAEFEFERLGEWRILATNA
jgi:hypothetical protein